MSEAAGVGEELAIEKLVPEGRGLGRLADGRVALAEGVVAGDVIVVEAAVAKRSLVMVQRWSLRRAAAARVTPGCAVWSRCGGCNWMMMDSREQAEGKRSLLLEALERTGRFARGAVSVLPCRRGRPEGYRDRIRLQLDGDAVGFFGRASHRLVEPERCQVASDPINRALARLRERLAEFPGQAKGFVGVEIRHADDGTVSLAFQAGGGARPRLGRQLLAALGEEFLVAGAGPNPPPPREQRFEVARGVYVLSAPGGFTQVNAQQNRALVAAVREGLAARSASAVLDLYAGAGNFSLPLAAQGIFTTAVEGVAAAVASARRAAREQGLDDRLRLLAGDVRHVAARLDAEGRRFDAVLVDPPRAGASGVTAAIARLARGCIAMCSCNPVTLARDLRCLVDAGWEIESIEPFDFFPHTHHVETLTWLRKPSA